MPVTNGTLDTDTKEQILDQMITAAEEAFGEPLDPNQRAVIRSFYDPVAEVLADQQDDVASVLSASQIETAEDAALDMLAALIGVHRREAKPATTRLEFSRNGPTGSTYTVPAGTAIQTDEVDPVTYETDQGVSIKFIDGFEDADIAEYVGDTTQFSTTTSTVYDGSYALTTGSQTGAIFDDEVSVGHGSTFHCRVQLEANTIASVLFGTENRDNTYRATVDASTGELRVELVDGGTVSTLDTSSISVPTGSWLHLEIAWGNEGTIDATLYDSSENEVGTSSGTDSLETFTEGGAGFQSHDTNGSKYWDNLTMSAASVDATATESGEYTNVAEDRLVVFSTQPTGIQNVTNPVPGTGGRQREPDDDFRDRVESQLSEGMRATVPALIARLEELGPTKSVQVIENDSDSTDAAGRPAHSFEAIVECPSEAYQDVADRIFHTKAGGLESVGGYSGTSVTRDVDLENGQTFSVTFSTPTQIQIYVDCSLQKTGTYAGDDEVQDSIVRYIGGVLNSGNNADGELDASDGVIYNNVLEAVMNVEGVYDVINLDVATSDPPSGTSNISIADSEVATADATDGSLTISSSDV